LNKTLCYRTNHLIINYLTNENVGLFTLIHSLNYDKLRTYRFKIFVATVYLLLNLSFNLSFAQELQYTTSETGTKNKKWIGLSSGVTLSAQFYRTSTNNPRQQPFMYSVSGAPALDIKGVTMPFNVIYSNQVFTYQQPFNQFGIAPRFKYGSFYLGNSSMRFSNYTMAGQRFGGVGADIHYKWIRFGGMYGRLRRQVAPIGAINDPLTFVNEAETQAFDRRGYTVKIGFGSRDRFVDFIYFKAYDKMPDNFNVMDWAVQPTENAIFGINSFMKIGKKVVFKNDWAISAFTRNTVSDTLEIENQQLRNMARRILLPTVTTNVRIAGETSVKYIHKILSPSLSYKRVELDYTSVGAYFFLTDIQQITAGLQLNLFKNKLTANGSFGRQSDNLQKQRLRTSFRNIGSLNLNFNPSTKWGISTIYTNYGITQSPLPTALTDTNRINQVNNSFTIIPRYNIIRKNAIHAFTFVAGYNAMSNLGSPIGDAANMKCYNLNLNYNLNYLPQMITAGLTPSVISTETIAGTFVARGMSVNAGKGFYKNQLSFSYVFGRYGNTFNGVGNGNTTTQMIVFNCHVPKWPGISFNIQNINNKTIDQTAVPSFNELIATISVSYNF